MKQNAPCGSWMSPITAELVASGGVGLGSLQFDKKNLYWKESRPAEQGRCVLVKCTPEGTRTDIIQAPFNARTRVHEYGGGEYLVKDDVVYFTNFADQQIYIIRDGKNPEKLTVNPNARYCDYVLDKMRNRLVCIRELHSEREAYPQNSIVAVSLEDGLETTLAEGADFYSNPRISPNGLKLCFLCWNHPDMPWDNTTLYTAEFDTNGMLSNKTAVTGGNEESVFQPEWLPDNSLCFISDQTGWWNPYRFCSGKIEALCATNHDFGMPQWVFGMETFIPVSKERIFFTRFESGMQSLFEKNLKTGGCRSLDTDWSTFSGFCHDQEHLYFIGAAPDKFSCVVKKHINSGKETILLKSRSDSPAPGFLTPPQHITFETSGGQHAHALYYSPANPDFEPLPNEKPPLMVISHGGPTASASTACSIAVRFWTSRGFAVLDVNYRGSTGYGREYRNALKKNWGIYDNDDCAAGAKFLADQGYTDPKRAVIRGGSAGGYCTLCSLVFHDVFKAGASYFGVSDAEALAKETHKFESRYLDNLIGPYPETATIYRERSPIHKTEDITCPVILLQGDEDKIVPPNQSEVIFQALKDKGIPTAYLLYEGEQHGFRKAQNIISSLNAEYGFYAAILRFPASGLKQPPAIDNLCDEWFEIVDDSNEPVGLALRTMCHGNPSFVHRTAHVVVMSTDGRLLLQKRLMSKDIQAGKWDTAVGGHRNIGETAEEAAVREMQEEIGVANVPLKKLFTMKVRNNIESENCDVFLAVCDGPFNFQKEEIEDLSFYTTDEVKNLLGTETFTPLLEEEIKLLKEHDLF